MIISRTLFNLVRVSACLPSAHSLLKHQFPLNVENRSGSVWALWDVDCLHNMNGNQWKYWQNKEEEEERMHTITNTEKWDTVKMQAGWDIEEEKTVNDCVLLYTQIKKLSKSFPLYATFIFNAFLHQTCWGCDFRQQLIWPFWWRLFSHLLTNWAEMFSCELCLSAGLP